MILPAVTYEVPSNSVTNPYETLQAKYSITTLCDRPFSKLPAYHDFHEGILQGGQVMRGIRTFLNGDFMGSTTISGLPTLQNLCQALNLAQNWAEEEKAFYITASAPVADPDYISVAHLGVDADGVRMVLYPDPTIVLPSSPEPPIEAEVESPSSPSVVPPVVQAEPFDPTPLLARVAGTRSASPDPRTPPGSGAVFVFRHAARLPGETLNYADDPLVSDSFRPTFTSPAEPQAERPTELPTELQVEPQEKPPAQQESAAQPISRPLTPPLRSDRRKTPPPRVHAQATRVIQSGPTVIRI